MAAVTTGGGDPFGQKVAPVAMPQPFSDLSAVYPNLSGTNAQVSSDVLSRLKGELSPETLANIQNAAATFGVASGMPGSGLQINRGLRDVGLTTEALQEQGLKDYQGLLPTISGTQTVNPSLQYEVNLQNAINRAAPDPAAAATYAQSLFDKYLQNLRGPAGGSGENPLGPGVPPWASSVSRPHYGLGGGSELPQGFWSYS